MNLVMRVIKLFFSCNQRPLYQCFVDNSEAIPNVGELINLGIDRQGRQEEYEVIRRCFGYKKNKQPIIPGNISKGCRLKVPYLELDYIAYELKKTSINEFAKTNSYDYE